MKDDIGVAHIKREGNSNGEENRKGEDDLQAEYDLFEEKPEKTIQFKDKSDKSSSILECGKYAYETKKLSQLRKHVKSVHDGMTWSCDQCTTSFTNENNLIFHIKKVHEQEPFMIGQENKPLMCDKCVYKTTRKGSLKLHKKSYHEGISSARYHCKECDASYAENKNLTNHVMVKHMGINFQCNYCEKFYNSKKQLKLHNRDKHENVDTPCDICAKIYPTSIDLWRHKRKDHNGIISGIIRIFPCEQCNYVATRSCTLEAHNQAKHADEKFACWFCGHRANCIQSLKWHMKAKHQ